MISYQWELKQLHTDPLGTKKKNKKHSPPSFFFCFLVVWDTPNPVLKLYFHPLRLGVVFISQIDVGSILRIFFLLVIDWRVSVFLCGCLAGKEELKLISFNSDATLQWCVKPENHSTKNKKWKQMERGVWLGKAERKTGKKHQDLQNIEPW